jgi:hypothetical protein
MLTTDDKEDIRRIVAETLLTKAVIRRTTGWVRAFTEVVGTVREHRAVGSALKLRCANLRLSVDSGAAPSQAGFDAPGAVSTPIS